MRKIEDINEYKEIVLNIMIKIDKICEDKGLKYFINYGTLLGAIRHKGFIPWDDDIDINMPRKDYDRLAEIINQSPECGLNFIRIETNVDSIYPYGKVCDKRTTLFEDGYQSVEGYGAFVDVFPFDYLKENLHERNRIAKKIGKDYLYAQVASMTKIENHTTSLYTNIKRTLIFNLSRVLNTKKLVERVSNECIKYGKERTGFMGVPWAKLAVDANAFDNTIDVEFEGHFFKAPNNYDEILTIYLAIGMNYLLRIQENRGIILSAI